jgi:hypothetical protein
MPIASPLKRVKRSPCLSELAKAYLGGRLVDVTRADREIDAVLDAQPKCLQRKIACNGVPTSKNCNRGGAC